MALITATGSHAFAQEHSDDTAAGRALLGADPEPSQFSPRWQYRTFNAWDAALSVTGAGIAVTSTLLGPPRAPRWEGGIVFDATIRNALRAESRSGRDRARDVGDVFYIGGALAPTLVDTLFLALGVRRAPEVAAQMLLIDVQAYAVAGALLIGSENLFARARPSMKQCQQDGNYEAYCGNVDEKASFISGHTGVVATSAGLICAHHQYLHLFNDAVADGAACGLGIGAALTTGIARIINDRHYATDILAAFTVGALSGYLLPVLGYYRTGSPNQGNPSPWLLSPHATQSSIEVRVQYTH
jgi:membrane-associated phospholipid phosphatase